MAKKKSKAAPDNGDKATIKKLRSDLASAQDKRDRWKKRAVKAEATAADLQSRLKVTEKSLKKARKARPAPAAASAPAAATAPTPEDEPALESVAPDAEWTVAQLRAEARRRGLTGLSNKPKAQLLAALA
jgi:hypothetical protein